MHSTIPPVIQSKMLNIWTAHWSLKLNRKADDGDCFYFLLFKNDKRQTKRLKTSQWSQSRRRRFEIVESCMRREVKGAGKRGKATFVRCVIVSCSRQSCVCVCVCVLCGGCLVDVERSWTIHSNVSRVELLNFDVRKIIVKSSKIFQLLSATATYFGRKIQ